MLIRAFILLLLMSCNVSYASFFGDDKAREQIGALRNQVGEMEARIAGMEQALKSQALLELYSQVETLGIEIGTLRGQIDVLSNDSTILQRRQKDFYIDLDSRLRQIEQPGVSVPAALPEPADLSGHSQIVPPSELVVAPEIPQPAESSSASMPIKELMPANSVESNAYDAAYHLFLNGDYAGAITQFGDFLRNYPQSNLAPGAAYWIGNAHYASRNYQDAINAQERLISIYPDSLKVPDALLNISSSQQEMADRKAAKRTLGDLIEKYPFSDAAEKARKRLTKL